ncbi:MAG: beta-hydroxyacyl-ACP dehydratase [Phycisphaerae bacterium]|nr:beta-hydroxyacyl-ACP dehydratase [Phycisphaerae bacterium]
MRWMWIDRILELKPRERLVAIKTVSLSEEHLHDHFAAGPGSAALPIMPASLIIEGMAQSAGILVGHAGGFKEKVVLAKVNSAEITREALPGSTLRYTATMERFDTTGAATRGVVELIEQTSGGPVCTEIGRIDLMFSHLDQNLAGAEFPKHNFVFSDTFRTLLTTSGFEAW